MRYYTRLELIQQLANKKKKTSLEKCVSGSNIPLLATQEYIKRKVKNITQKNFSRKLSKKKKKMRTETEEPNIPSFLKLTFDDRSISKFFHYSDRSRRRQTNTTERIHKKDFTKKKKKDDMNKARFICIKKFNNETKNKIYLNVISKKKEKNVQHRGEK